jgi:hypothetical protein
MRGVVQVRDLVKELQIASDALDEVRPRYQRRGGVLLARGLSLCSVFHVIVTHELCQDPPIVPVCRALARAESLVGITHGEEAPVRVHFVASYSGSNTLRCRSRADQPHRASSSFSWYVTMRATRWNFCA